MGTGVDRRSESLPGSSRSLPGALSHLRRRRQPLNPDEHGRSSAGAGLSDEQGACRRIGAVPGLALDLIVLRSSDLDAARAFYEAVGVRFTAERHGTGPDHLAATLAGGLVLELYPATTEGLVTLGGTGDIRLGFVVDDVAATVRAVREAGGKVIIEPTTKHGRHRAVLADPDGRRIELTAPG